jgi:bacterioferritin-associated ferredoxin
MGEVTLVRCEVCGIEWDPRLRLLGTMGCPNAIDHPEVHRLRAALSASEARAKELGEALMCGESCGKCAACRVAAADLARDTAEARREEAERARDEARALVKRLLHPERQNQGHREPQPGCLCVWCKAHRLVRGDEP